MDNVSSEAFIGSTSKDVWELSEAATCLQIQEIASSDNYDLIAYAYLMS